LQKTTAQIEEQTADDLALDEVESNYSVDEDAVPARKVVVNNRVCPAVSPQAVSLISKTKD